MSLVEPPQLHVDEFRGERLIGPVVDPAGPHRDFNRFLEEVEAVAGVSVLSSWNFRHMVNFWRIQRYSEVNLQWGYVPLDIRSPRELENEE